MTPREKLAKGRIKTFSFCPYLASYIYAMKQRETPGTGTVGVTMDGVLTWDPEFVESLSEDTLAYVIIHEALHLIFRHHVRANQVYGTQPDEQLRYMMNVAGDLTIEQVLQHLRPIRPQGAVYLGGHCEKLGIDLDFDPNLDMLAYFNLIRSRVQQQQQQKQRQGNQNGQPSGANSDVDSGTSAGSSRPKTKKRQSTNGKPGAKSGSNGTAAACAPSMGGSAGDGVRRPGEQEDHSWSSYQEAVSASRLEKAILEQEKQRPGSTPGALREVIKHFLRPEADPFDRLRSTVATATASPIGGRLPTYRRLARKQPADVCRLRGLMSTAPSAVVIVDTSGSMGDRETKLKALEVVAKGLRKLKRVKVICYDTRLQSSQMLSSVDKFEWSGGGGTAMDAALAEVDRTDRPDSIILITDGVTEWPAMQPRARVVVALTERNYYRDTIPKWCTTVPLFKE